MIIYECNFYVYIFSLVFLSLQLYMHCSILPQKLVYGGFLEYVVNAHSSWFLMKGAPFGSQMVALVVG